MQLTVDRQLLYDWYSAVLDETGWTANEWASSAKISATNITRFLKNPNTAAVPRFDTLYKLMLAVPPGGPVITGLPGAGGDIDGKALAEAIGAALDVAKDRNIPTETLSKIIKDLYVFAVSEANEPHLEQKAQDALVDALFPKVPS